MSSAEPPPSGMRRDEVVVTSIARIAHEIRNALFGVAATLDAFDERFQGTASRDPYVRVIREELDRVSSLMRSFLALGDSRRTMPTSMSEVLEATQSSCRAEAEAADVALTFDIEPGLPPLGFDRKLLTRAFGEATLDAIQVSPRGARVQVRVHRSEEAEGSFAICDVTDEGPRLADADDDAMAQPFFTRRRGGGATLAATRRIIAGCGGTVEVGNRVGGGCLVRLRIPL